MNQANSTTTVTVTSVPGNPVLNLDGCPSRFDIIRAVQRKFGSQLVHGFAIPHSFCCVVDPEPNSNERPAEVNLWRAGHEDSRRWAGNR